MTETGGAGSGILTDGRELIGQREKLGFEQARSAARVYWATISPIVTEDAVQESWIRLGRTDVTDVENLCAWLTTVVGRAADDSGMSRLMRGARALVAQAATLSKIGLSSQVILVNGNSGTVCRLPDGACCIEKCQLQRWR